MVKIHTGDKVREVATDLFGQVTQSQDETGQGTTSCIVVFAVAGRPQTKSFNVETIGGLEVVECPHEHVGSGISPTEPLC